MTSKFRGGEIYGIPIPTVFDENNSMRCAGCGEPMRPGDIDVLPGPGAGPGGLCEQR